MSIGMDVKFTRYVSPFSGREVRQMRVGKGVTSPFRQIADAIRASRPYDRIEVENGKYFEALTINHPLELCSAKDGEPPVIISRGPCLKINTDGPVLVQSMSIIAKGTKASDSQGILIERGKPLIQDCEISSVHVTNDATPQIRHCHICNSEYGFGLSITGRSGGVYEHNDISFHNAECVHINTTGSPDIHHNRITQKKGKHSMVVTISGRLLDYCEPVFRENIVRGGGETANEDEIDPESVHSTQMLLEDTSSAWACLVCTTDGATPLLMGNLLCNGLTGFYFKGCNIPPERFCGNRVINCAAWGVAIGEATSLFAKGNDIQRCGGGIHVCPTATSSRGEVKSPRVTLTKCDFLRNFHYGMLIDRSIVAVDGCNVSECSVGIAFLGNCAASIITHNTFTRNHVAAFSVMRHGVAVIENNTVRGCGSSMYGAFVQEGSSLTLRSNRIGGTSTSVYVRDGSRLVAEKNTLQESSVHHVVLVEASKATLQENTIEGSACASVVVTNRSECIVRGNVMYSSFQEGVLVEDGGNVTLERNSMSSMAEAIYVKTGGSVHAEENDVTLSQYGVVVEGRGSKCTVLCNRFRSISTIAVYALGDATVTIKENTLTDSSGLGIQVASGAEALVEKNTITNFSDGAVHFDGLRTLCRVFQCRMENVGYGVWCTRRSTGTVEGNHVRTCKRFGVACESAEDVAVHDNNITGAGTGIMLSASGDIHDNVIEESEVGISACTGSVAKVKNHRIANCNVGVSLEGGASISLSDVTIQGSQRFGVVVDGPAADSKVSDATIEGCKVAGVLVRKGGGCRFDRCVVKHSKEDGIRLEEAGAVVFEQCTIVEHCHGVTTTGGSHRAGEPLLVNCSIDGSHSEAGVLSTDGGVVRLERCKISARCPQKGSGAIVHENGVVVLSHCDVTECTNTGVVASPGSRAVVEHTTIDNCGIGITFTSPEEEKDDSRQLHEEKVKEEEHHKSDQKLANSSTTRSISCLQGSSSTSIPSVFTQMMIRGCTEAGIWYKPGSNGAVTCTTVEECATGVFVERESYVTLHTTVVNASPGCGIVLLGPPSSGSELVHLTISNSGEYGLKVERGVDVLHDDDESNKTGESNDSKSNTTDDGKKLLRIKNTEIIRNVKGGVLLEACVCLDGCTISQNSNVGVVCQGVCRPLLSGCHLHENEGVSVEAQTGSMLELRDCVLEDAPVGVRVQSVLKMARCIARHLGVAVDFRLDDVSVDNSTLCECAFSGNTVGVSCTSTSDGAAVGAIILERCMFNENPGTSVCIEKGPRALLNACTFESSTDGVKAMDKAIVVVEACTFKVNSNAISMSDVEDVEVKNSAFARQLNYAISVVGNSGLVRITDNTFSENGQCSASFSAEGASILASGNMFEGDACGMLIHRTPQAHIYNNHFHACQNGVIIRGAGSCGDVFSNTFQKNVCGCLCEQDAFAQLWRNVFEENSEFGMCCTSGANPIVVENTFSRHTASSSSGLRVQDGGVGHYAFNQYVKNACGVHLGATGDTVVVNNSAFEGNSMAVQLMEGVAAHILVCTFSGSTLGDVHASGSIEQGRCVLAYNSFTSKGCAAVTVCRDAAVVVFRCVFLGANSKGLVQGCRGRSQVLESLFYQIAYGVVAQESSEGSVGRSIFIRCATSVEACARTTIRLNSCNFLAKSNSVAVLVHGEAAPVFQQCSFVGCQMTHPLLRSSGGGGVVENSSFTGGDVSVILEGHSTMKLHKNTFFKGAVGVTLAPLSKGRVEDNVFHPHHVAAVKIMDNAGGVLTGNAFVQPLESGGMMAGMHNVIVENCKTLEMPKARASKETADDSSFEEAILTAFVEYLTAGPHWVRQGMGETPHAETLPLSVVAAMNELEADAMDEEQETGNEVGRTTEEMEENLSSGNSKPKQQQEEDQQQQRHGAGPTTAKKGRKKKEVEVFSFPVSNTILRVPKNVQRALLAWVDQHGITLNVEEVKQPTATKKVYQVCDTRMLKNVGERMSALKETQRGKKRGNFVGSDPEEVRGADTFKEDTTSGEAIAGDAPSEPKEGTRKPSVDVKLDSTRSTEASETALCPRLSRTRSGIGGSGRSGAKEEGRKRRRVLPPPLRSTDKRAHPSHSPHSGPLVTLVSCLHKCGVEKRRRRQRKKIAEESPLAYEDVASALMMLQSRDDQFSSSSYGDGRRARSEYDEFSHCSILASSRGSTMGKKGVSLSSSRQRSLAHTEDETNDGEGVKCRNDHSMSSWSCSPISTSGRDMAKARGFGDFTEGREEEGGEGIQSGNAGSREGFLLTGSLMESVTRETDGSPSRIRLSSKIPYCGEAKTVSVVVAEGNNVAGVARSNERAGKESLSPDTLLEGDLETPIDIGETMRMGLEKKRQSKRDTKLALEGNEKKDAASLLKGQQAASGGLRSSLKATKRRVDGFSSTVTASGIFSETNSLVRSTSTSLGDHCAFPTTDSVEEVVPTKHQGSAEAVNAAKTGRSVESEAAAAAAAAHPGLKKRTTEDNPLHSGLAQQDVTAATGQEGKGTLSATIDAGRVEDEGRHSTQRGVTPVSGSNRPTHGDSGRETRATTGTPGGGRRRRLVGGEDGGRVSRRGPSSAAGGPLSHQRPLTPAMDTSKAGRRKRTGGPHAASGGSQEQVGGGSVMRLPKLTLSSLHGSQVMTMGGDGGDIAWVPAVPPLSEMGRALLEALEGNVFHNDSLLQAHLQTAMMGPSRGVTPASAVSGARTLTSTPLLEGWSISDSESEAEVEDIIALLRWLADMREQKLLSQGDFRVAVNCIQTNTKIPFFLSEGSGTGGEPTLMVRLPQSSEEAVIVPLMGGPVGMTLFTRPTEGQGTVSVSRVQLHRASLGAPVCTNDMGEEFKAFSLPCLDHRSDRTKAVNAGSLLDTVSHQQVDKPALFFAHAKLPRTHFQGRRELPGVLESAFKARPWPRSALHSVVLLNGLDKQLVEVNSSNVKSLDAMGMQQSSVFSTCEKASRKSVPCFNPAAPQETSPYNKSTRVAAFIDTGTSNFMM